MHYYMGPSPFTDKRLAKAMLEAVFPIRVSDDIQEGSPESQLNFEEKKLPIRHIPGRECDCE